MKRTFLVLAMAASGTFFLGACNKSLKDDIKSMQSKSDGLLKSGEELKKYFAELDDLVANGEPITVTTTFTDDNNKEKTVQGVYKFKSSSPVTQWIRKSSNGTFTILVARLGQIISPEQSFIRFNYNPITKEASYIYGIHSWGGRTPGYNNQFYFTTDDEHEGLSMKVDVHKLDPVSGEISFTCTAEGNAAYTDWAEEWKVPNKGTPVRTVLSFTGKLNLVNLTN